VHARTGLVWLMRRMAASWDGEHEDLLDHLVGNDDAVVARQNKRNLATIVGAGGEVG
jgi:hypothetical protein